MGEQLREHCWSLSPMGMAWCGVAWGGGTASPLLVLLSHLLDAHTDVKNITRPLKHTGISRINI